MKTHLFMSLFGISALPIMASPIVGAWVHNNGVENDSDVFVFLTNGIYFHVADSDVDTMERGSYTWDEESGQLSLSAMTQTEGSDLPSSLAFPVVGDSAQDGEFQRVFSDADPLVGAWSFGDTTLADTGSGVVIFLENGVYFHAEDVEADPPFFQDGIERGTYRVDAETRAFTANQTADTNGEVGFSNPEGPAKVSLLGDTLIYQPGFIRFALSRVSVRSQAAEALGQAQILMASESGMFGVMVNTVPGFFYTVERSDDLGIADGIAGIEGTGSMSGMLLETDPAIISRAFFRTRSEVQNAISSAEIVDFLSGQEIDGILFAEDGTWSRAGESGEWSYEVLSATEGELLITNDENGNDPAVTRTELSLDFSEVGNFSETPVTVRNFTGDVETNEEEIVVDLEPSVETAQIAPSEVEFPSLITGKTIRGLNFQEANRWSAFGEAGDWTYSVTSPTTATLTLTFDSDANDPAMARDDYLMAFTEAGGNTEVVTTVQLSDNNEIDEVYSTELDLTRNTYAPTAEAFAIILADRTINETFFNEDGTFIFAGSDRGQWSVTAVNDSQLLLTQTYDEDGNNPAIYREESRLSFNGTNTVDVNYREFDGGALDFEVETTFVLD